MEDLKEIVLLLLIGGLVAAMAIIDAISDATKNKGE
jgi:hypothetical protein